MDPDAPAGAQQVVILVGEPWPDTIQVVEVRSLRQALNSALLAPKDEEE